MKDLDHVTPAEVRSAMHHAAHGDMDGEVCLLNRCALHWRHNERGYGYALHEVPAAERYQHERDVLRDALIRTEADRKVLADFYWLARRGGDVQSLLDNPTLFAAGQER